MVVRAPTLRKCPTLNSFVAIFYTTCDIDFDSLQCLRGTFGDCCATTFQSWRRATYIFLIVTGSRQINTIRHCGVRHMSEPSLRLGYATVGGGGRAAGVNVTREAHLALPARLCSFSGAIRC